MTTAEKLVAVVVLSRRLGVRCRYERGWRGRGMGLLTPRGFVCHHTGSSTASGDKGARDLVRDGRADLRNLLSNLHMSRSGLLSVMGDEVAWHAGTGGWRGLVGNSVVLGLEWECNGVGEPATPEALRAYPIVAAAACRVFGFPADNVCFHNDWRAEKPDPRAPNFPTSSEFRRRVAAVSFEPPPPPVPDPEEPDMEKEQFFAWMDEYYRRPQTEGGKSLLTLNRNAQSNTRLAVKWLRAIGPKLGISAKDVEG